MKKTIKLLALILSLSMVFSSFALAETQEDQNSENDVMYEVSNPQPFYLSFNGTVKEIDDNKEGITKVYLEGKENMPAYFILTESTYYVDNVKIEVGIELTGYYESGKPMILIYPPQYSIDIVAPVADFFMKADKFDGNLLSADKTLKLNISEDTEIIWENNTQINWIKAPTPSDLEAVLTNRRLIVFYDFTTKSLPAQTSPKKIIVLSQQEIEPVNIIVNDVTIDSPIAYIDENGTVMVPLRAISEALSYEVTWNNEERCVAIGSDISVKINNKSIVVSGNEFELETTPIIKNDRTYVPLSFFKEALNVKIADLIESNIIIHNGRFMAE